MRFRVCVIICACLFYSQAASKAGFVLSPAAGKKGDFQALKLGQIDITVRATGGVNLLTSLKVFFISYFV